MIYPQVFAVSKNDTLAVYACKTLNKQRVMDKKRERLVINERNILIEVNSPFITCLKYAFQDESTLYLTMDLMTGGELQYHLNKFSLFPEKWARFYIAGIILAIEYATYFFPKKSN